MRKLLIMASMLFAFFMMSCNNDDLGDKPLQPKSDKRDITNVRASQLALNLISKEYQKRLKSGSKEQIASVPKDIENGEVIPIIGTKGKTNLWIVKNTAGFVVVSGTRKTTHILGYSMDGKYDGDNMPPAFKQWLENANKFMNDVRETECKENEILVNKNGKVSKFVLDVPVTNPTPSVGDIRTIVKPAITYLWRQKGSFNNKVKDDWSVGCGALAVGMIIRFNEYANSNLPYRDWNKIKIGENEGTQNDTEYRAEYLNFIRTGCKSISVNDIYKSSSTYTGDTYNFFKKVGYTKAKLISDSYGYIDIINGELRKGHPVWCRGSGHAYTIHGLQEFFDMRYFQMDMEPYEVLPYFAWFPLHYINWGWGTGYNGWYSEFGNYGEKVKAITHLYK